MACMLFQVNSVDDQLCVMGYILIVIMSLNLIQVLWLIQEGVNIYKQYAHHVGFSDFHQNIVHWKYCVCSKQGWHQEKEVELIELEFPVDFSNKDGSDGAEKVGEIKLKTKRK